MSEIIEFVLELTKKGGDLLPTSIDEQKKEPEIIREIRLAGGYDEYTKKYREKMDRQLAKNEKTKKLTYRRASKKLKSRLSLTATALGSGKFNRNAIPGIGLAKTNKDLKKEIGKLNSKDYFEDIPELSKTEILKLRYADFK